MIVVLKPVMIYLTQLIYIRAGCESTFHEFEDAVLPFLAKHRGELLLRLRPDPRAMIGGSSESPYEVHVVRFETEEDLGRYANDEERQRLLPMKAESVRSTLLIKGELA
jgi:hypothetical protein